MKRLGLIVCVLSLLKPGVMFAYDPCVSVIGESSTKVMPDTAVILVGVSNNNLFSEEAAKNNSASVGKIKEVLGESKINLKNVKITEPSISSSQPNYWSQESDTPFNFKVTRYFSIELNVEKMEKEKILSEITRILDSLRKAGVNVWGSPSLNGQQNSSVSYMVKNTEKHKERLDELAIQNARERAQKLAKQLGVKIGGVYVAATQETFNAGNAVGGCQFEECSELLPEGEKIDRFEEIKLKRKVSLSFRILE